MNTPEEGNKIIALFDGYVVDENIKDKPFWHPERNLTQYTYPQGLKYHTSWDWLRPVIEKVHDECKLYSEGLKFFDGLTIFSTIDQVWQALLQFIQWYNSKPISS